MKPIFATYKPAHGNSSVYAYGARGEVVFAYSDGGWHHVVLLLDEDTAPRLFDAKTGGFTGERLRFLKDFAADFEYENGDYNDLLALWTLEQGIMEDEHIANFDFSRNQGLTINRKERIEEQQDLRDYLETQPGWKVENGKYIRPARNPAIQRAIDLSNIKNKVNGSTYLSSSHFQ